MTTHGRIMYSLRELKRVALSDPKLCISFVGIVVLRMYSNVVQTF